MAAFIHSSSSRAPRGCSLLCLLLLAAVQSSESEAQQATLLADAHVSSTRPAVNSGSLSNLDVGGGYTALLQFDLGSLPVGLTPAQVSRATLRLYCNRADTPGSFSAQLVTSTWAESTVTYATLPALATGAVATATCPAAGQFVTLDITAALQGWLTAPASNFGLALTSSAATLQFDSKENDLTAHAPELDLATGVAGPQGATGATGPAGPTGAPGAAGPQGAIGPQGLPGAAGAMGPQGVQGLPGPTGATGLPGPAGSPGATGPTGPQGVAGLPGATGPTGAAGLMGPAGPAGPQGVPGVPGATGATGAAGPVGATGVAGPTGLTGPAGLPGPTGATGAPGPAGQAGTPGLNFRGAWAANLTYTLQDAVTFSGSTYLAQAVNTNSSPDANPQIWSLLAQAGSAGAAGPAGPAGVTGAAATISVGPVTVLPAGSQPTVTNTGTSSAAVLAFGLPAGGGGSGGASSTGSGSFAAMFHSVSYTNAFYAPNTPNASGTETPSVMAWVPRGCTASRLDVYSQQSGAIKVTLRSGSPGSMLDTPLVCSFTGLASATCSVTGSVTINPGSFLDFRIDNASGTPAGVWTALECD